MDKKTKLIIIFGIIIVILLGYISYGKIYNIGYKKGFSDGNAAINSNMLADLNTKGYISFNVPVLVDNETKLQTLRLGVIKDSEREGTKE